MSSFNQRAGKRAGINRDHLAQPLSLARYYKIDHFIPVFSVVS
jgi:hypothetical protein